MTTVTNPQRLGDDVVDRQLSPELTQGPTEERTSRFGSLRRSAVRAASSAGWALAGFTVLVGLYWIVSALATQLPSPWQTALAFRSLFAHPFTDSVTNKGILLELAISLERVFIGFGAAAIVGIPLGLLMGSVRRIWQVTNPVVQVLSPVSPLAWFPIWLIILASDASAAVFVIFLTALWPIVLNAAAGASSVPRDDRNVARVFRFGRKEYVRHVLLPNAMPSIITGLRVSMGMAWMVIVAVEMLSGSSGIGSFVWNSYNAQSYASIIVAIVVIGITGFGLDTVLLRLGRRFALPEVNS